MKRFYSHVLYVILCLLRSTLVLNAQCDELLLTGILDGPLSGGQPKAIELYATQDITDLSSYGLELVSNGNGSKGIEEFTFPAVSVTAGTYIYVASNTADFNAFFGFNPDYT